MHADLARRFCARQRPLVSLLSVGPVLSAGVARICTRGRGARRDVDVPRQCGDDVHRRGGIAVAGGVRHPHAVDRWFTHELRDGVAQRGSRPRERPLCRARRVLRRAHGRRRAGLSNRRDSARSLAQRAVAATASNRRIQMARSRRFRQVARVGPDPESVDHVRRRFRLHHLEARAPFRPPNRSARPRATASGVAHVGIFLAAVSRRASSVERSVDGCTAQRLGRGGRQSRRQRAGGRRRGTVCRGRFRTAASCSGGPSSRASRRWSRRFFTSTKPVRIRCRRRGPTS